MSQIGFGTARMSYYNLLSKLNFKGGQSYQAPSDTQISNYEVRVLILGELNNLDYSSDHAALQMIHIVVMIL
jgi:hypothetical protein